MALFKESKRKELIFEQAIDLVEELISSRMYRTIKEYDISDFNGCSVASMPISTEMDVIGVFHEDDSFSVFYSNDMSTGKLFSFSPLWSFLKNGAPTVPIMESIKNIGMLQEESLRFLNLEPDYLMVLKKEIKELGFEFKDGMKIHGVTINRIN